MPISAALRASQSFASSPHIPTFWLFKVWRLFIRSIFSSEDILAYTYVFARTDLNKKESCSFSDSKSRNAWPVSATSLWSSLPSQGSCIVSVSYCSYTTWGVSSIASSTFFLLYELTFSSIGLHKDHTRCSPLASVFIFPINILA